MESNYVRTMQKNDLILYHEGVTSGPGYYVKMLSYNRIPGMLSFAEEPDKKFCYRYDIREKQSLAERLKESKLNHKQLDALLRNLSDIIMRGRAYLLDENDYVLCPELIFFAGDSDRLYLCYYPFLQKDIRLQMTTLLEFLLSHIDYQDLNAVKTAYELYMKCKGSGFGFVDILRVLDQDGGDGDAGKPEESTENVFETEKPVHVNPAATETVTALAEENAEKEPEKERTPEYCLQAEKKEASIYIKEFPCYIGKSGEVLSAETLLQSAGAHAKLSKRGESVYIEDIQSGKGTFVNGRRVAGNEIQKLWIGDSVMLADKSYRFVRMV